MTDIKDVAEPWKDPLGNVWCATPHPDLGLTRLVWVYRLVEVMWTEVGGRNTFECHPDLLRGLGRTLPPVPTPKKVAGVATLTRDNTEYAVKGDMLYYRHKDTEKVWHPSFGGYSREYVAAAHAAFQQAGDVLPGEEGE